MKLTIMLSDNFNQLPNVNLTGCFQQYTTTTSSYIRDRRYIIYLLVCVANKIKFQVILPGGLEGSERLSKSHVVGTLLKDHEGSGKIIAAICAGNELKLILIYSFNKNIYMDQI